MAIKLYQLESCPYCRRVRGVLDAKGLEYEKVDVPLDREERKELFTERHYRVHAVSPAL